MEKESQNQEVTILNGGDERCPLGEKLTETMSVDRAA